MTRGGGASVAGTRALTRPPPAGRARTSWQPSSSDTTTGGRDGPGSGASRVRPASRPRAAAAGTPASGIPAIPHHAPSADAAAASARQSRPNSATATTDPRASPPRGSSPRSAGSTGSAGPGAGPGPSAAVGGPVFPGVRALGAANDPGCPAVIHLVSAGALPTSLIIEQRFGHVKVQVRRLVNAI